MSTWLVTMSKTVTVRATNEDDAREKGIEELSWIDDGDAEVTVEKA